LPIDVERAAMMEFDGGIPRPWAEQLSRLHPDRPPSSVSPRQWRQFYDDCSRFLDRWASKASALGWSPSNVFGWDTSRPFSPSVRRGLAWRIDGGSVVDLTKHVATIVLRNGQRLTFERHGAFT
jgi:hypothetical protein